MASNILSLSGKDEAQVLLSRRAVDLISCFFRFFSLWRKSTFTKQFFSLKQKNPRE